VIADKAGGLDLANPDSWTEEEDRAFTAFYLKTKGHTLPGHDFWVRERPDVLKRYRVQAIAVESTDPAAIAFKLGPLTWLHFYSVIGFVEGVRYQIANARGRAGATRKELIGVLAIAFLHSGPLGMFAVAASSDALDEYEDPADPTPWPEGWVAEPEAFRSGMDFGNPELTSEDRASLEGWYLRVCGEVPRHVAFLAEHRPLLLKAQRNRFEFAIKDELPKQLMPILLLHLHASRGWRDGIREAALMARGLGVPKQVAVDAVLRSAPYGGTASIDLVADAAGDVFDDKSWD
jgi:hypothetical protein